jgi:phosphoadenosine phosphosulfate reductase
MNKLVLDEEEKPVLTYEQKVEKARRTLCLAADMSQTYYNKPLIIAYSGGKDSDCLLHLAKTTLKPNEFEVLNSHTTIDPPEVVYHIRDTFKRLKEQGVATTIRNMPTKDQTQVTMWDLIVKRGTPPTRIRRYCCAVLKETGAPNRLVALGVRAAESDKRQGRDTFGVRGGTYRQATFFSLDHTEEVHHEAKNRDPVWDCTLIKTMREHGKTVVNPIYEFTDEDLWRYIHENNIELVDLYERGYKRVGCIGCPMATYRQRQKEFADYPRYKGAWIRAFQRMLDKRKAEGKDDGESWKDGQAVFEWWMQKYRYTTKGQLTFDVSGNITED